MPLKLEITKKALLTKIRWSETVSWITYLFNPVMDPPAGYLKKEKEKLETALYNKWQQDWDENEYGRTTYGFIPDVRFHERSSRWFTPSRPTVDILTGYGSINQTLFARNCVESPDCPRCPGIVESIEHMMYYCPLYDEVRHREILDHRTENAWTGFLADEESFQSF